MTNRLARETSPYLLQHKSNPVDWFPWGPEALTRARTENKPILLSVGYSACHWCHVMEKESFENAEVAQLMNENFVCIKVDREERPDLDQIYQKVAQALTMGGGWPLTVFLTPDLKPFYGGTYFPPEDRYGRAGFKRVLAALSTAFHKEPDAITYNAEKLTDAIAGMESVSDSSKGAVSPPTEEGFVQIKDELLSRIDWENGGSGGAPKFPNPMIFSFLWRTGRALGDVKATDAVRLTLKKMAEGGIYDQLGGGFSRYSVDQSWNIPHFEKMLYDNGLLLKLYSEVLLSEVAGSALKPVLTEGERELFQKTVFETVQYVLREMTSPEGVFYTAQDADSEGEEGKFFAWDPSELRAVLTEAEARVFALRFGVTETGNFEHGKTVLAVSRSLDEISKGTSLPAPEVDSLMKSARQKLLAVRERRVKPGLDNKVLTSWNGLMISGLAWASRALKQSGQKHYQAAGEAAWQAAVRAFEFIENNLSQSTATGSARLFSNYHSANAPGEKGSKGRTNAYLDDYAFMSMAALDLSRWAPRPQDGQQWLGSAREWIQTVRTHFKDGKEPGYFFTSDDHEALLHRPKTLYDQAIPSGTGVTLGCMVALAALNPESPLSAEWEQEAKLQLGALFPAVQKSPHGFGEFCNAAWLDFQGPVTVAGLGAGDLVSDFPVFQKPSDGGAVGWVVCHEKTCRLPSQELDEVRREIYDTLSQR